MRVYMRYSATPELAASEATAGDWGGINTALSFLYWLIVLRDYAVSPVLQATTCPSTGLSKGSSCEAGCTAKEMH